MNTLFQVCTPVRCFAMCCFVIIFLLNGCAGPRIGRVGDGNVHYDDPEAEETVNTRYGSTDLQVSADYMVQSLLQSQWISKASTQPRVRLREVTNFTDEHIDTKGITDKIRVKLLRSGKVRFLADIGNLDQVVSERDLTEQMTDRGGNDPLLHSDYILTGAVRSIRKKNKNIGDAFYQITMELVDHQTGEVLWADEKQLRKVTTKPKIGW